jgi:parallel beta-helix repeat protein
MRIARNMVAAVLCLCGPWPTLPAAHAAETFHTCAGYVDTVPTTISTQGVWCLRHDLSTAIASGAAITVATNNVTIDCNDFKLGGLAAGNASQAYGLFADNRQNVTIRHCNIRGFNSGIFLSAGDGHLVEDNRLDNNLYVGISVSGDNNLVQRNRVFDTGGAAPNYNIGYGIVAHADILGNIVSGVFANDANSYSVGIFTTGDFAGVEIRDNVVSGLVAAGSGEALGIYAHESSAIIGNRILAKTATAGSGITNDAGYSENYCSGNIVIKFATPIERCLDGGGNDSL